MKMKLRRLLKACDREESLKRHAQAQLAELQAKISCAEAELAELELRYNEVDSSTAKAALLCHDAETELANLRSACRKQRSELNEAVAKNAQLSCNVEAMRCMFLFVFIIVMGSFLVADVVLPHTLRGIGAGGICMHQYFSSPAAGYTFQTHPAFRFCAAAYSLLWQNLHLVLRHV